RRQVHKQPLCDPRTSDPTHQRPSPMKRILTLLPLAFCLTLTTTFTAQADDKKADPTGTWTWTMPGRDGRTRTATLKLKLEGDKLTGTMVGRNNTETAIEEAKLKGDE